MFGYHGKFLKVDLTSGNIGELNFDDKTARDYLGGCGLSARLIYNSVKTGMDVLCELNPLVFAAGPYVGTPIPMVSRSSVCGVSPQTGYWGEATTGGIFPFRLKAAGYDGIYITGKAKKPVYLLVIDGRAEIRDASKLWGKNSYQTQELIKMEINQRGLSVSCIGEGGENLVKYAGVMNDEGRTAGRCGMGTLMGSKNLKAVAVTGTKTAPVADETKVRELSHQFRELLFARRASMMEYGTLGYMETGHVLGDSPARYFTRSVFPVHRVSAVSFRREYTIENYACFGCPTMCGRELKHFKKGPDSIDGPEYETAGVFGPLSWNFDKDIIVQANQFCNETGIDTISAGVTIAYAMYLFEQGVLSEQKAGMKIEWGDGKTILKLLKMIVKREGIGDLLAEGTLKVAQALGADPETVAAVKGLEIPMHDPRNTTGMAISYATGSRGACHLRGDYYSFDLGSRVPEYGIQAFDRFESKGKSPMAAKYQNFKDVYDSILMCKFANATPTQMVDFLNAVTGWNVTTDELLVIGDRSMNIKRAISNKLGVNRTHDHMPGISIAPMKEGATSGKSPDMDTLLREYYQFRQWDWETGKPKAEKLVSLGLADIASDIWK